MIPLDRFGNSVYIGRMTPATRKRLLKASVFERLHAANAAERNSAICAARDEGATLREIADIVGMTHAGVRKIINNAKDGT